ncbi:D-alanyl-D-alanine carboxypeptidase [Acuticoccus kandeliae]|uniref:D-alanyl-D-alanine carboxypeptidase n=1 Tax=Acuticoccus kandeliae TaxID=2073160 RepID=UPI001FE3EC8E|nr:D-alanyl-D-alanine carboxypeptidase [Acuticoccus kandeliae]
MSRCLTFVFCLLLPLLLSPGRASANEKYAGYVYDVIAGKVLYEQDADDVRYPASLTKIMTLYITFEELAANRLKLDDKITVSAYAAARPPSKIGFKPGGTIAVRDAVKALVTKSANDVATALGENIEGSEVDFAKRMTRTAKRLGMKNTVFHNASGLPHPDQHTTAHDMATLGIAIQRDFPQYYGAFQTRVFEYGTRRYGNHNKLLGRVEGVDGIKTGYIRASGFNLVTSVRRDGRHLVAVVMGGNTGASRDAHMRDLIAKYLPKAQSGQPMLFAAWSDFGPPPIPDRKPSLRTLYASRLKAKEGDPIADTVLAFASETRAGISAPRVPSDALTAVIALTEPAEVETAEIQLAAVAPMPSPTALPRSAQSETVTIAAEHIIRDGRVVSAFAVFTETESAPLDSDALLAAIARSQATPGVTTIEMGSARSRESNAMPDLIAAHAAALTAAPNGARTEAVTIPAQELSGWQIQVGAVASKEEAANLLEAAVRQEPAMGQQERLMLPVRTDKGTLYRARFAGFQTKEEAKQACKQFANHNRPCWAVSM